MKKLLFPLLLLLLTCQKKQIINSNPNPLFISKTAPASIFSVARIGASDYEKIPFLDLGALDKILDLEADTPYLLEWSLGKYKIGTVHIQKDFLDMWEEPVNDELQIPLPISWKNYPDADYFFTIKLYKNNTVLVYHQDFPLALERFVLRTGADLQAIEKMDPAGAYVLGNDIQLQGEFRPIGLCSFPISNSIIFVNGHVSGLDYENCQAFSGQLNGKNFTISGLKITDTELRNASGIGLFGVIDGENALVKNLRLQVDEIRGQNLVGALAGLIRSDRVFENIEIFTSAEKTYSQYQITGLKSYTGGMAGLLVPFSKGIRKTGARNIHVALNVSGGSMSGGVLGAAMADLHQINFAQISPDFAKRIYFQVFGDFQHTGGLVGYLHSGHLSESAASVDVLGGVNSQGVGGLVGTLENSQIQDAFHVQVAHYGTPDPLLGSGNHLRKISGNTYVGGIVGQIKNLENTSVLRVFSNALQITGLDHTGILVGNEKEVEDQIHFSVYNGNLGISQSEKIRPISPSTSTQKDFEALGFDFVKVWKWGKNQKYGFPFF